MHKYINILIFIADLLISFYILDHMNLKTSAQNNSIGSKSNIVITINPGAIDTNSQNPVTPKDITIPIGTTIIWLNKDSSPHLIASGTPDKGPTNIFYGNYFESGQAYNITLDKPGMYGYSDPGSPNINGSITVSKEIIYFLEVRYKLSKVLVAIALITITIIVFFLHLHNNNSLHKNNHKLAVEAAVL